MLTIALPNFGGGRAWAQEKFVYPPAAFIRIDKDSSVMMVINKLECGQGVFTSLSMLLADELECDWSKVRAVHAPVAQIYAHPGFGLQMTRGSDSVKSSWQQLRTIGATARAMLLQAAAQLWNAPLAKLDTKNGVVVEIGGQKRRANYGDLAEAAMKVPVPAKVGVKADPLDRLLIGKATRRLDAREKVNGAAQFGIDVRQPEMRVAVVVRPPVFGGKVRQADLDVAKLGVKGLQRALIVAVDRCGTGVALVADSYWPAKSARDKLRIEWDLPAGVTTADQFAQYRQLAQQPGLPARRDGDSNAIGSAARTITADFEFPYLAHAAMEPLNIVVDLRADAMTLWCGSQFQTIDQVLAAQTAGLPPEKVELNTMFAGGAFGRRANPNSDYVFEGVLVAKALRESGVEAPVKVIWSREDDMRGGYYRPACVHRVAIGINAGGKPIAWNHTIVGQSILKGTPFEKVMVKDGIDTTTVEGVVDTPYTLPNMQVSVHHPEVNVPVLWWRSVGHSHTAFVMETLIDELAATAGEDPITYRLALLDTKQVRERAVLNLVREKSLWGKPLPKGRARGVAMHGCAGSVVAYVADVSLDGDRVRVHKVTAAIECGTAVNPLTIEAQVQSALVFGLSAALYGRITLKDGRVEQSNFTDYPVLRINEMPEASVHIVASNAPPAGVGECGTPPIAPAVANALFQLTGKRLRKLPFDLAAT